MYQVKGKANIGIFCDNKMTTLFIINCVNRAKPFDNEMNRDEISTITQDYMSDMIEFE